MKKLWFALLMLAAYFLLFQFAFGFQALAAAFGSLKQETSPKEKPKEIVEIQTALPNEPNSNTLFIFRLFGTFTVFSYEKTKLGQTNNEWPIEEFLVNNSLSFAILIAIAVLSGFFLGNTYSTTKPEFDPLTPKLPPSPRKRTSPIKEKQSLLKFMTEIKSPQKPPREKPCQLTIKINYDNTDPLSNFTLHLPEKHKKSKRHGDMITSKLFEDSVNKYEKLLQNGHGARNFEVVSMLGRGGFGSVYKARHLLDEQFYAIKVIKIQVGVNQNLYEHKAFREVLSMMRLNSKHVLRYYNCWLESEGSHNIGSIETLNKPDDNQSYDSNSSSSSFGNANINEPYFQLNLYIQMEYSKGCTLKKWLERPDRIINRKENCLIFRQLLKGVLHIHQNNFIHRDLKPANIFIDKDLCVKIGDFGLAVINNYFDAEPLSPLDNTHSTNVGSPLYLAPEQENSLNYDEKVDVYPLGMILLELCVKIETNHERYMLLKTLRNKHELPKEVMEKFDVESQLILWMTTKKSSDRPSIIEVMTGELMGRWENEFQLSPINYNL